MTARTPAAARAPASADTALPAADAAPQGPLHWRQLVTWLLTDGVITLADGKRVAQRFAAGDSAQHPLVRLSGAGWCMRPPARRSMSNR
ncbi:hypothetical protein X551_03329 [Methylibium sp. T29]|nr:hypothetical protein X551_03329 [Methylibium sp. T29]EWS61393.1 hypothetical protein Y694_00863 [Methylibium sp. T29-B]